MLAPLLTAALLAQALMAAGVDQELTPRQRQAKLAREGAIALRVHAVPDPEREAVLAARMAQLAQQEPPAWVWSHCEPWQKALGGLGGTTLGTLGAMAWLAARPAILALRA
jgi:hypothetical protein